jgi:predicted ArsR family transcriptional regulator
MDAWWGELDEAVLEYVAGRGSVDVEELAADLGLSERAATSLIGLLAQEGRVRIRSVARATRAVEPGAPAFRREPVLRT